MVAFEGTHIHVVDAGPSASGKTEVWRVFAKAPAVMLGHIQWYGPWRCYTFQPWPQTVFEWTCLREIADFCASATKIHRSR